MTAAARRAGVVAGARTQHQVRRAVRGRRLPVRTKLPLQLEPNAIVLSYYKALRPAVARARALIQSDLLDGLRPLARRAADGENVHDQVVAGVDRAQAAWLREFPAGHLQQIAAQYAQRISTFQRQQLMRQLVAGLGAEPALRDAKIPARLSAFAVEGAAKLKSLVLGYFADVQARTLRALRPQAHHDAPPPDGSVGGGDEPAEDFTLEAGVSVDQFFLDLGKRGDVADSRAGQLAMVDTRSLFGDLNESRQKELGLDEYVWTTMGDDRVRPEHAELDGRRFGWDRPPAIGNPGDPSNCRCVATPVLDSVQDELN